MFCLEPGNNVVVKYAELHDGAVVITKGKYIEVTVIETNVNWYNSLKVKYLNQDTIIPLSDVIYKVREKVNYSEEVRISFS